jgi:CRISPR system Cascade subunit CasE
MYLSRLMLDPRHRRVQSELARPYELHRSILSAFPSQIAADERVLYRLDAGAQGQQLALLVQSQGAPDWGWAESLPGYLLPGAGPEVKVVELALRKDQVLAFRLRANPTVKKATHEAEPTPVPGYLDQAKRRHKQGAKQPGDNGIRLGLAKEEDQRNWLARKGTQCGFRVLSAQIVPEGLQVGHSGRGGEIRRLAHLAVRFEGVLQVTDADLMHQAVRNGVGSAKAFGFGLLSLAPAP